MFYSLAWIIEGRDELEVVSFRYLEKCGWDYIWSRIGNRLYLSWGNDLVKEINRTYYQVVTVGNNPG